MVGETLAPLAFGREIVRRLAARLASVASADELARICRARSRPRNRTPGCRSDGSRRETARRTATAASKSPLDDAAENHRRPTSHARVRAADRSRPERFARRRALFGYDIATASARGAIYPDRLPPTGVPSTCLARSSFAEAARIVRIASKPPLAGRARQELAVSGEIDFSECVKPKGHVSARPSDIHLMEAAINGHVGTRERNTPRCLSARSPAPTSSQCPTAVPPEFPAEYRAQRPIAMTATSRDRPAPAADGRHPDPERGRPDRRRRSRPRVGR